MRKPASEITDRAKRYRANTDIPEGTKVCTFCGSSRDLGVDHIDGYEEHGEPENLIWLCRSCNQLKAAVFKAAGVGRATNQYNPFRGLFKGLFEKHETYRRHGPAHPGVRRAARESAAEEKRAARELAAEERRADREAAAEERARKGRPASRYKGVTIYRKGSGEYYTSLDPDSEFESLRDAKRVVDHFRNPASSLSSWSHAVDVLRGQFPGNARQAARVVRSTPPGRRRGFLGQVLRRNPRGASVPTFEQYIWAVTHHTRKAKDEGGSIIHATPAAKRREYADRIAELKRLRGQGVPF